MTTDGRKWPSAGVFKGAHMTLKEHGTKELVIPGKVEAIFDFQGRRSFVPCIGPMCPFAVYEIGFREGGAAKLELFIDSKRLVGKLEICVDHDWLSISSFDDMSNVSPFYDWVESLVVQEKWEIHGYDFYIVGTKHLHCKPPPYVFLD